jgi:copper chaperone CopZ
MGPEPAGDRRTHPAGEPMKRAIVIPIAIAALLVLAFTTTDAYRVATAEISFVEGRPATVSTVEYTVNGLKCRGTANLFAHQIADVPGVVSLTAYARTHTALVEYDPTVTNPAAIREAAVEPIVQDGKTYEVFEVVGERARD